jgi:protein-disulfide isomerase
MSFRRTKIFAAAVGLTVIAVIAVGAWRLDLLGLATALCTEKPSMADLMQPGPLGEESQGSGNAPITVIEYASLTCTHCARFARNVYPVLKTRYIDTGKVHYIMREAPTDQLALAAAALARCAGDGRYFDLVDALFRTQTDWAFVQDPATALLRIAKQAGFTQQSFEGALSNQQVLDGIQWVAQRAQEKFCVDGTPTFFINGMIHHGEMTVDELDKLLEPFLKKA